MWSPNSPAPPPPPSVFVFWLPPSASEWKSGLTGIYHSPPTGQIIWLSKGKLPHFESFELPASPAVFSVSGLARGGEERLEGGSEEESVRTAFWNPADQSWGILPQRERERDWKREERRAAEICLVWRQKIFKQKTKKEMSHSFHDKLENHVKGEALWKDVKSVGRVEIWAQKKIRQVLETSPVNIWVDWGLKKTPGERGGMSWLSPVSWAKWTWTAVRGGEGEEDEDGLETSEEREQRGERGDEEEREEEERSQGCRQVLCLSSETTQAVIHTVWTGDRGIFTCVSTHSNGDECVHLSG